MGDTQEDELAQLMPRTQAASERADVNVENLKEYVAAAQHDPALTIAQRTSVMIRTDVRKDADGFEDIDDFWAEEDVGGDKDDTEGEESSILSESVTSSANLSMVSAVSEREVNLSGLGGGTDDSDNDMDVDDGLNDTMELESHTSQRGANVADDAPLHRPAATPKKQVAPKEDETQSTVRQSHAQAQKSHTPSRHTETRAPTTPVAGDDNVDFSFGDNGGSPFSSGKKTPQKSTKSKPSPKATSPAFSTTSKSSQKKKRRETRDSFGRGGFDNVSSPFSIHDAVLTPLSNASEKNLPSIHPFSENGSSANSSADSPNIRVTLFKSSKDTSAGSDNVTKRVKKARPPATAKQPTIPKTKTRKYAYKSTPASDVSFEEQLTDNDDGSFMANSGLASDGNDSDWDHERTLELSKARNGRDGDLSYADEVLKEAGNDGEGLRRSKRKRYKPLAWYKGEHYVYERRQSGVGLVIPTVAAIERVGTATPMKKSRPAPKKASNLQKKLKPLPRAKLPKDLVIEDGEWADLWDISAKALNKMNVVCRFEEIEHRELPAVDDLPAGTAGQSFNLRNPSPTSRWIAGHLGLIPGAAKEAETVGDAAQVFVVMGGQPQALEVAVGPAQDGVFDPDSATRFLLSPKDQFYIPAQNAYYLKNHSETATTELHFMILKPDPKAKYLAYPEDQQESKPTTSTDSRRRKPSKTKE